MDIPLTMTLELEQLRTKKRQRRDKNTMLLFTPRGQPIEKLPITKMMTLRRVTLHLEE
jgi:hypothetical protein